MMTSRSLVTLGLGALLVGCAAQPLPPTKTIIVPAGMDRSYDDYHYAPAVRVGDTVIVSGIPSGPEEDYEAGVRRMFGTLKRTLEDAGATLEDVVELTTFHRNPRDSASFNAEFEIFARIHGEFFREHYPAWSAVGTTALLSPAAAVEMRAVAVVGSGKTARVQRAASKRPH
ncbi:Rid family hydrolase [Nannocystis radixulma]|uniref:Rid family hydrolase n=1 Tax=Nannocystis radixulma TaxID=2995305 RepID=A0ABT5BCZ5_9BACT|nr:Rid family hydrolase [Nannocystis radixulma]MDC0671500.1 Rid family hydrolase [Nannocystis radixulma]MDC0671507.1 Rid family hydrolase [Nannocystis radixulma]MDC0673802.1 Rid family hydrolase [Nannocystis radixulma]